MDKLTIVEQRSPNSGEARFIIDDETITIWFQGNKQIILWEDLSDMDYLVETFGEMKLADFKVLIPALGRVVHIRNSLMEQNNT